MNTDDFDQWKRGHVEDARGGLGQTAKHARRPEPHVIVVFGGNGDLSKRKLLPALFHLENAGLLPEDYRIIGNSRSEFSNEAFDQFAKESIEEFSRCGVGGPHWDRFAERLSYVSHEFKEGNTDPLATAIREANKDLGGDAKHLYYLSVPPPAFPIITKGLGDAGLNVDAKIVYEKPFGTDLESFGELSSTVHRYFDEDQVFRIDHFLGKEAVQNILALRFANGMFEPVWNRQFIDHVEIDVPETLGVEQRASFYENTGALRDMLVTHLFQVLSFVAMEPPYAMLPEALADETAKVFESIRPLGVDEVVRGQYRGYRDEEGVDSRSTTETYVAACVHIDNWRWSDVPFLLRTGKRLKDSHQTVTLAFKEPPRQMFREDESVWFSRDHLTFRLGEEAGVAITFLAKKPGPEIELGPAKMDFHYDTSEFGSELMGAYEHLIHDALLGERTLFTRGDGVERTWEVVQEVLENPPPLHSYPQGSWGPRAADELIAPRHWHVTREDEHRNSHKQEHPD
ncbi:MAG: glucose-6-phosphate dehydrogenase [Actinomycetota bacterium]